MAGVLRFTTSNTSYNGEDFRLEIWDKNFTGSSSSFNMGVSGPVISYDTDGDKKFSKILTSKLEFPFLIGDSADALFIDQLRTTYNERDVYVYVFNSSSIQPVWAGYIIMDLGDRQDVAFPYEIKLQAIDGLALLKDIDFVPDIAIDSPYTEAQTYIPNSFKPTTFWIKEILLKAGLQTSNDASTYDDYTIKTSVNWFNVLHTSTAVDPLRTTTISSRNFYKEKEDSDTGSITYNAENCYNVLEDICKTWGMRCVFWQGNVHFIQIGQYIRAESGTVASPININAFKYDKDGNYISDAPNLGTENVLYDLRFETVSQLGLQKLSGTNYGFYPPVKEVTTNHLSVSNQNNFQSFPLLANNGGPASVPAHYYETTPLGVFSDANNFEGIYTRIMLNFNNSTGADQAMTTNWTIRAREVGNATWQKMLDVNSSGTLIWGTFVEPTTVPYTYLSLVFQSGAYVGQGMTTIDLMATEIGSGNIPIDASFIGDWEFEYYTHSYIGTYLGFDTCTGHGGILWFLQSTPVFLTPTSGVSGLNGSITYSNVTGAAGANSSMFCPVFNGAIGTQSQSVNFTSSDNSYIMELGDLPFGDNEIATAGGMKVWNGTNFVLTDFTGKWGVGSIAEDETFSLLLCKEILNHQQDESYRLNATTVLSSTNKSRTSGGASAIKVVNPIGKLRDKDNTPFVFLRGAFNLLTDECSGEWFEYDYSTPSGTTTTTTIGNSGSNTGGIIAGSVLVGLGTSGAKLAQPTILTQIKNVFAKTSTYVPVSSSPISQLTVTEMLTSTFKIGDVLQLFNVNKNKRYSLTLTSDYDVGDTTILFDPITLYADINIGSIIILDDLDLGEQYQRKSKGTIAGFDVDATSLEKGGVSIDGFLDSDRMVGASDTTLATSESIKAYVDSESGGISNYKFATSSGTGLTSATNGIANAVVVPFDTSSVDSAITTIALNGSGGIAGISDSEYSFSLDENAGSGVYEIKWNIAVDVSVVLNRFLGGITLETGLAVAATPMTWVEVSPSRSWIYNRGAGGNRYGSTSNSILYNSTVESSKRVFRVVFWKEDGQASGKLITEINGCSVTIKQI